MWEEQVPTTQYPVMPDVHGGSKQHMHVYVFVFRHEHARFASSWHMCSHRRVMETSKSAIFGGLTLGVFRNVRQEGFNSARQVLPKTQAGRRRHASLGAQVPVASGLTGGGVGSFEGVTA